MFSFWKIVFDLSRETQTIHYEYLNTMKLLIEILDTSVIAVNIGQR